MARAHPFIVEPKPPEPHNRGAFHGNPEATYSAELRTLGDHLRKKRLDLGLLQRDVAQQLGVAEERVCHWEIGRSRPKPYLIPRIIEFLEYSPWNVPATYAVWLVMARRINGLSRKRLATRLGVDESTVFPWESGWGQPRLASTDWRT